MPEDVTIRDTETSGSDCEIISRRTFNASVQKVFSAWTDPTRLAQWWGPNGFTNTFYEFDMKPGGYWRFTMHGPNGANYENESVFVEISPNERIVLDHLSPPTFRITATFSKEAGQTHLGFCMRFPTAEDCNKLKPLIVPANEENFDRLEAVLAQMP